MTNELATKAGEHTQSTGVPKAIVYLWCLIPLGVLGAVLTLVMLTWIYSNVRIANREANDFDRKFVSHMETLSSTIKLIEVDFRKIFDESKPYEPLGNLMPQLEDQIRFQRALVGKADSSDDLPDAIEVADLSRLRNECLSWRKDDVSAREQHHRSWATTREAIADLRAQLDSEEGRRRLFSIQIAQNLRKQSEKDVQPLIDSFLSDSRHSSLLSVTKTELSDLEIVCIRLFNEKRSDLLSSIHINEIRPSIDRLEWLLAEFDDQSLIESYERIVLAILGSEQSASNPRPGDDMGLYRATVEKLASEVQGDNLHQLVLVSLGKLNNSIDQRSKAARDLREIVAEVASHSLRTGALTIVLFGAAIGIVFGLLTYQVMRGVQRSVTELRESHETIRIANEAATCTNKELHDSLAERDNLQNQLLEAQKLESIGQLAAGIAHEINTPTQYVGDNTRFVQDELGALLQLLDSYVAQLKDPEAITVAANNAVDRELLDKMDYEFIRNEIPLAIDQSLEGVQRITTIVNAMKDFSHPGADGLVESDLNNAIQSTAIVCSSRWKYTADIEFDLDASLGLVPCYLAEFNQVVLNLIVNAADAIETFNPNPASKGKIKISTIQHGDRVEIRVADDGGGMPESVRSRIFDPFFTTKEVGKGTGQGLSISHNIIVNKHGGTITCETQEGKGSLFVIELPITPDAESTPRDDLRIVA